MKEKRPLRTKWLSVRLSAKEEKKLLRFCQSTTARGISEYARAVLLKEPVIVRYRSASADAFLEEMIELKNELSAIGNTINQLVHQLQGLEHASPLKAWLVLNEAHQKTLQKKADEILEKVHQIYTLWLQK